MAAKKHPTKPAAKKKPSPRAGPISLAPLTPEQAIRGIFAISKEDVARIVASKPEKKGRKGE
jgi:hypothetical protein